MVLWTLPRVNGRCQCLLSRSARAARVGYRPKIAHELDFGDGWTGALILCNSGQMTKYSGAPTSVSGSAIRRLPDWHALTGEATFSSVEPLTANEAALARRGGPRL